MFLPLQSNSKVSGVPKDSKFPLLGVWVSSSHLPQSGVATIEMRVQNSSYGKVRFLIKTCMSYETKGHITKWSFNWHLVLLKIIVNKKNSTPNNGNDKL